MLLVLCQAEEAKHGARFRETGGDATLFPRRSTAAASEARVSVLVARRARPDE